MTVMPEAANPFGPQGVTFRKSGRDIKAAVANRCRELQGRLDRRNSSLDKFLDDRQLVRAYLIRSSVMTFDMHTGQGEFLVRKDDISSEQMDEIKQLCHRILEIEQELHRLKLVAAHMDDNEIFELGYQDLVGYGFDVEGGASPGG